MQKMAYPSRILGHFTTVETRKEGPPFVSTILDLVCGGAVGGGADVIAQTSAGSRFFPTILLRLACCENVDVSQLDI